MTEELFARKYEEPRVVMERKFIGSGIYVDVPTVVLSHGTSTLRLTDATLQVEIATDGVEPRTSTFQVRMRSGDFVVVAETAAGEPVFFLWRTSPTTAVWSGFTHEKL
jgi:hypothetical protein